MGVRLKRFTHQGGGDSNQGPGDRTTEQCETEVDGQRFHWGPGQVRNFMDNGVGLKHAAQLGNVSIVKEDTYPFGDSRS
jgi:hypothetical protein